MLYLGFKGVAIPLAVTRDRLRDNFHMEDSMAEAEKEETRVRMNYKVSAKGVFQPDVTAEAETVETATRMMVEASAEMNKFADANGFSRDY